MDTHDLLNRLTTLDLKAQLLGKVPLEDLDLRDTNERMAVALLRGIQEASEAVSRGEHESRLKTWLKDLLQQ